MRKDAIGSGGCLRMNAGVIRHLQKQHMDRGGGGRVYGLISDFNPYS